MINLMTAIDTKFRALTGGENNSFFNYINGCMYEEDKCPPEAGFPRCISAVISGPKDYSIFTKERRNTLMQFDIYALTMAEARLAYSYFTTLFQNCNLSITSNVLIWFREVNYNESVEDLQAIPLTGETKVSKVSVDYEVFTEET